VDAGPTPTSRRALRRRRRRRGPAALVAALLAVGAAASVLVPRLLAADRGLVCTDDPVAARAVAGLAEFGRWLGQDDASGFVGEVGWPAGQDAAAWSEVAETWYRAADAAGLPVTAWSAGRWPDSYPMAVYSASTDAGLDRAGPQAAVVESHPSSRAYLRGVDLADGSFAAADTVDRYSSTDPGRYGYDYTYGSPGSYTYLQRRGVRLIRLAATWERLQPEPFGRLSQPETARLRAALETARRTGIAVVLDLHGYGGYRAGGPGGPSTLVLGTPALPTGALADVWSKLVTALGDEPALAGLGLLNEPTRLAARGRAGARLWEAASQQAVDRIRAAGSRTAVVVTGYGSPAPGHLAEEHPRPWLTDPLDRVVYDAHVYFDADGSGHYADRYADERSLAAAAASPRCSHVPDVGWRIDVPVTSSDGLS
jgi:hypothetical protein